jgi:Flp pilus assembly protein TadD
LRQELATAEDPTASALELAGFLAAEERHEEALAVVQQAETRSPDPRLRVARAGLQRDLGRRHLALAELETLVRERGAKALHPGLLYEVAELNWLEGNGAQALANLREIDQVHGDDPWCLDHRRN